MRTVYYSLRLLHKHDFDERIFFQKQQVVAIPKRNLADRGFSGTIARDSAWTERNITGTGPALTLTACQLVQ